MFSSNSKFCNWSCGRWESRKMVGSASPSCHLQAPQARKWISTCETLPLAPPNLLKGSPSRLFLRLFLFSTISFNLLFDLLPFPPSSITFNHQTVCLLMPLLYQHFFEHHCQPAHDIDLDTDLAVSSPNSDNDICFLRSSSRKSFHLATTT